MKIKFTSLCLELLAVASLTAQLHAQGTAFTYQASAGGSCDELKNQPSTTQSTII
ncbi:MAG: hypothetical protein L0Y58_18445 [Verrucomicrobia subdivision 3 bacterium]|nr:hypothetical protein [Limisphaerales bacterium]